MSYGKELAQGAGGNIVSDITGLPMYYLQRHHAKKDYERVRADNRADWEMANRYNSPVEQMNRLREAGLNPNLVYGKGADQAAVMLKGADLDSPAPKSNNLVAPVSPQQSPIVGQQLQLQKAQTDNIMADTRNKNAQNVLLELESIQKQIKNATDEIQRRELEELYADRIERYRLENDAIGQNILSNDQRMSLDLQANDRAWLDSAANRSEGLQRIAESKSRMLQTSKINAKTDKEIQYLNKQIENMEFVKRVSQSDAVIKELDAQLAQQGVPQNSNYIWKTMVEFSDWVSTSTTQAAQDFKRIMLASPQQINTTNAGPAVREYMRTHKVRSSYDRQIDDSERKQQGGSW